MNLRAAPLRKVLLALPLVVATSCLAALWPVPTRATARTDVARMHVDEAVWAPPAWHPAAHADLLVLDQLDGDGASRGPRVSAPSAIIADLDSGEVLFSRDADTPRSIASVTKLFSALALAATGSTDLDRSVCLGREHWPAMPGARSKFETGDCHTGWEYLGAALVASDNRGAMALPTVAGLDHHAFVARMTEVAGELGAATASFSDPAGLLDENTASARDVLKAVVAVSLHPDLGAVASAPTWRIESDHGPRELGSTNRLVERHQTLAAKTGYTDTAHYCFATVVRTEDGRRLAVVVLGAPTSDARFRDTEALLRWARDPRRARGRGAGPRGAQAGRQEGAGPQAGGPQAGQEDGPPALGRQGQGQGQAPTPRP
jgi:D-alanyl-D-alanine carboxypeptidase